MEKEKKTKKKSLPKKEELKEINESVDIEDLFHAFDTINKKNSGKLQDNLKSLNIKNPKISKVLESSKSNEELKENIKNQIIENLENRNQDIKDNISYLRKKGLDLYIESVKIMSFPLKIKMYHATGDKKDYFRAKNILDETEKSVKEKLDYQAAEDAKKAEMQKQKEAEEKSKTQQTGNNTKKESNKKEEKN